MSQTANEHRSRGPISARCAVITVSDTRTAATDKSGDLARDLLVAAGHEVILREIIPDDPDAIRAILQPAADRSDIDAVLLTGGTGVSPRDRTYETVAGLLTKELPGFGELFRMLSFQEIQAAAMLSRAIGGLIGRTAVFSLPGSPAAVRLALEKLIVPELGHILSEARK